MRLQFTMLFGAILARLESCRNDRRTCVLEREAMTPLERRDATVGNSDLCSEQRGEAVHRDELPVVSQCRSKRRGTLRRLARIVHETAAAPMLGAA
jgi:hypothetical protein